MFDGIEKGVRHAVKFLEKKPVPIEIGGNPGTLEAVTGIAHTLANPKITVDPAALEVAAGLGDRIVQTAGIFSSTVGTISSFMSSMAPWHYGSRVAIHTMTTAKDAYTAKKYAEGGVEIAKHLSTSITGTGQSLEKVAQNLE